MSNLQKNVLTTAISMLMTGVVCVSANASDQEIYNIGFTPRPVVMFALDNSGSMSVQGNRRRAFDLKDSMQAVLLGDGNILPARNIRAGVSVFESAYWYPIFQNNDKTKPVLYYTAVHPATSQVKIDNTIKVPRRDAGQIISPAMMLDDYVVYPSSRIDRIPSNGDVISRDGNTLGYLSNTDYSLNSDSKRAYIRFQADIPRGATIKSAYLEMRSNETYNSSGRLNVRLAKHNSLYSPDPSVTNLQTYNGTDTNKRLAPGVDRAYIDGIFTNALPAVQNNPTRTEYDSDNIAAPMRVYSIDVKSQIQDLITSNPNWCGMGDVIFEIQRATNNNFKLYADREDRVNPQLHIEWELTDNAKRTNNCMFTDTKRSSSKLVRNLGNVGSLSSMRARQAMNLQIQRIVTDTATPSTSLYAETAAYLLGNTTKPLSNTSPINSTIDFATGLTTGSGSSLRYLSPIETVRDYQLQPTSTKIQAAYDKEQQCGQHGIYFLTDGEAEFSQRSINNTNDKLFANALGWSSISCNSFDSCVQTMARSLVKNASSTATNRQVKVKTFTVGFNHSGNNLRNWATAGGGQYTVVNESTVGGAKQGIVDSINAFLDDVFSSDIPETIMGSPTQPIDPLTPTRIQPYAYYASLTPKLDYKLWLGNINKYNVVNGQLYDVNKTIKLFKNDGSFNTAANGFWSGGVRQLLPLGITGTSEVNAVVERQIFTNRKVEAGVVGQDTQLNQITADSSLLSDDTNKKALFNLLGYKAVPENTMSQFVGKTPDLRQVGSVLHSTPILITQKGSVASNLSISSREDYLIFGSTQGILHILDKDGEEVFAFIPNEMLERQPQALDSEELSFDATGDLYYGIDGPWTAYTRYVANADGSLTVGQSDRSTATNKITGKQYIYGGLRMGGRSYYALDLTHFKDADTSVSNTDKGVKLKFHINPKDTNSEIVNKDGSTPVEALNYMGQSWSKPTIATINFEGKKQLVMIVGGGYDADGTVTCADDDRATNKGYECASYNQTNKKGAGVYIFNAENGKLLWWTGANATAEKGAESYTEASDMKFSVVSQISVIDRDNDGLVDNLYVGDLGGQVFRIDLNNALSTNLNKISARVVRLLNHNSSTGSSPRFYEAPSLSVHADDTGKRFAIAALTSGNRSSPLSGGDGTNQLGSAVSADDGIFVLFDKDVASRTLFSTETSALNSTDLNLKSLVDYATTGVSYSDDGWVYRYGTTSKTASSKVGVYKGLESIYSVDNILYANVYHRDGTGVAGVNACASGVRGDSYLYRFCLPTGKCDPTKFTSVLNTTGAPDRVKLGAGILGTNLGADQQPAITNVITNTTDCSNVANKSKIECQSFTNKGLIQTLRWYESQ